MQWHPASDVVEHFPGARVRKPLNDDGFVVLPDGELHVLPGRAMQVLHVGQRDGPEAVPAWCQSGVLQHSQSHCEAAVLLTFQRTQSGQMLGKSKRGAERDAGAFAQRGEREVHRLVREGIQQSERAVEHRLARRRPTTTSRSSHAQRMPFIESVGNVGVSTGEDRTVEDDDTHTRSWHMIEEVLPVLIVGGGPVGLALAEELSFHETPVTVIEPRTIVEHSRPRAKTTSVRTMEHFRRWGVAVLLREAAPLGADWSQRVTFVQTVTGLEITHVDDCLGLSAAPELTPERAQQVTQPVVEEVLRADLAGKDGVELLFGWRAVEVTDGVDSAQVVIENEAGDRRTLAARWVVGADGPRSLVRQAMGASYEGSVGGRPNVNITFRSAELGGLIPHEPSIHYWVLNPESPGVVGPLDQAGRWWAISTGTEHVDDVDHAAELVRSLVGADVDVEILATDPWQARMLLADKYRSGRLFIVGDAAHQNPPWGGHGFNTGVGDAVNLGWKLAAVQAGWASDDLLDSYGTERRPIEEQTIALASTNMAALSVDLSNPALMTSGAEFEAARDEFGPAIARMKAPEFYSAGLVLGYGYGPTSHDQAPTPAEYRPVIAAGNRLPFRFIGSYPIYDMLGDWFTVIGSADAVAPLLSTASERGIPLAHLDTDEPGLVLVRPDQHIAWVGERGADWAEVLDDALRGFRVEKKELMEEGASG